MQLIEINSISAKPLQALFTFSNQMVTGRPFIVRARANHHSRLGRDDHLISSTLQSLAEDFLR
jgi:hypothetical protein